MSPESPAFQDLMQGNHCFGCGSENPDGLQIKSYWSGNDEAICRFEPQKHHNAGPPQYLNGGIIATIIDCHCVCTAVAKAYRLAGREIGAGELIWFVTGRLEVSYQKPVAIDHEVVLRARVDEVTERKIWLDCELRSGDQLCVTARVLAVKVPGSWHGRGHAEPAAPVGSSPQL